MNIQEFNICLVPEGAEYISPYPDAIEISKITESSVSYNKDKTEDSTIFDEIQIAITPEGEGYIPEGGITQHKIYICPEGYECKCGRGTQRDDVLKWWWYLDRNVFDWLGLNFRIKRARKLTRLQLISTESGLLYDFIFNSIPLNPGEDCKSDAYVDEFEDEKWLVDPTPGHLYHLILYYENPTCSETKSILYETTELTGGRVTDVKYGVVTETNILTTITEIITFKNSDLSQTSYDIVSFQGYEWIDTRYSLGTVNFIGGKTIQSQYSGIASLRVTYAAMTPQQQFTEKPLEDGGLPHYKINFYLYGEFWIKTSDFTQYNIGDWCLLEKIGTNHPVAGDPFAVYSAWKYYDQVRAEWVSEIRKLISSKPYDVLFTSENVARIKPPSDSLRIVPKG